MKWYGKYLSVYEKPYSEFPQEAFETVKSNIKKIQSDTPIASVVVIALNEEKHLLGCLWSLSESKCKYPIEIIGVDNNSYDKPAEIFQKTALPYYTEVNRSCGYARNKGLEHAKGKYYICIDSDTMYPETYVERVIEELEKKDVVAVSCTWGYIPGKGYPRFKMWIYEFVRDLHLWLQSFKRPELSVRGLVFSYHTKLGREVGYRVRIIRGEDGAMAMGLKKYGKIRFVRTSKVKAFTCTARLSEDGGLADAFKRRVTKALRGIGRYFTKREVYKDQDSNIIKD